jgi:DNA-directed RNA polymerase subunit RPC12/RpoP
VSTIKADVNPCRKCGSPARAWRYDPDESMHAGGTGVTCQKCGYEITVKAQTMKVESRVCETGWDHVFRQLAAAKQEVVYQWNAINPKPRVLTPEEERQARRAWAAFFIEERNLLRIDTPPYVEGDYVSIRIQPTFYTARVSNREYKAIDITDLYDQVWQGEYNAAQC